MKKECVAMLLAGGQGSRLYVLTGSMAKPAVPFGGKYRIIDFPLSNCVNSGIDTVGVLTQYQPLMLNEYIGSGKPWDLDRMNGGVYVLPPYQGKKSADWYKGTANAIYQNLTFINRYDPEYVLILSGDHVYKMDYAKMIAAHKQAQAVYSAADGKLPTLSELSQEYDHLLVQKRETGKLLAQRNEELQSLRHIKKNLDTLLADEHFALEQHFASEKKPREHDQRTEKTGR